MNLELMALRWLWLDRKCHYVLEQRSPRLFMGTPDVIGITRSRYLIEIEIKRSASDFRADFKKRHRGWMLCRDGEFTAKQTYYLMPRELAEKLESKIPEWAGLMCDCEGAYSCTVLKVAPNNPSRRLSLEECVRAARLMTNHMMTTKHLLGTHFQRFAEKDETLFVEWDNCKVGTYQI